MNKMEKAFEDYEKMLDGAEEDTILTSSALLLYLKIAQLMNDSEVII